MMNHTGDSCPLDILITQTQQKLIEAVSDAVQPMGWRCNYVEIYIEDGLPTAKAQLAMARTDQDQDQTKAIAMEIFTPRAIW